MARYQMYRFVNWELGNDATRLQRLIFGIEGLAAAVDDEGWLSRASWRWVGLACNDEDRGTAYLFALEEVHAPV